MLGHGPGADRGDGGGRSGRDVVGGAAALHPAGGRLAAAAAPLPAAARRLTGRPVRDVPARADPARPRS